MRRSQGFVLRSSLVISILLAASACDGSGTTDLPDAALPPDAGPAYPDGCENVSPYDCLLPWPSSYFLHESATTATGVHIDLPAEGMPRTRRGRVPVDPAIYERFDGFSPATSMVTVLAPDIDRTSLPDELHIADSLEEGSPTVLLEVASDGSATRVAHYAELDDWEDMDPERRPLYIRPAARLRPQTRYVVAIRGVTRMDGSPVEPSAFFRALRDGSALEEPSDVEARRAHFEEVFTILESAGVARASLIQAWDFETASDQSLWRDAVTMRDDALRRIEADTETRCTVTSVVDAPSDGVWRRVDGTVRVPLYLMSDQPEPAEMARVARGADGLPAFQGWADLPFVIFIPTSAYEGVRDGSLPNGGRFLDYGHGLFGSRLESRGGSLRDALVRSAFVSIAIDWWGMSEDDTPRVALTLSSDFSLFPATAERLTQGIVNHVSMMRAFIHETNGCVELPELQIPLEGGGTAPAIDRTQRYYYGNSQGGIMGGAVAGIGVDVERYVLGVGGMSYAVMIPRSSNWVTYGAILRTGYENPLQRAMMMQAVQSLWDLAEPSTFASHLLSDPLPCATDVVGCESGSTPLKHILMQIGRGDAQVPNVSSLLMARTAGVPLLVPAPFPTWGLTELGVGMGEVAGPDGLAIYDIPGVPTLPLGTANPGGDNPAHGTVRRSDSALEQLDLFLRPDGQVVQVCEGPCDPG